MKPKPKQYLGDSVYAEIDSLGRLVLTTENIVRATNTIVLEHEVLEALLEYVQGRESGVNNGK